MSEREANQQRVDAAAQRVRQAMDYRKYLPGDPFRKDVELLIEIALAPVLEIFAAAAQPAARIEEASWWVQLFTAEEFVHHKAEINARMSKLEHDRAVAMNESASQNLPAAAQPAAAPMAWTPQVEVYRTELMRRFSNKLSMEEIADFSYWAAQPQRESEPICNGPFGDEEACPVHGAEIRKARGRESEQPEVLPGENIWLYGLVMCGENRDKLRTVLRAFYANVRVTLSPQTDSQEPR